MKQMSDWLYFDSDSPLKVPSYWCDAIRVDHTGSHISTDRLRPRHTTYYHVSFWNLWLFRFKLQSMSFIKCSTAIIWYYQRNEEQNLILQKGIYGFISLERKCPDMWCMSDMFATCLTRTQSIGRHCPQIQLFKCYLSVKNYYCMSIRKLCDPSSRI